MVFSDQQEIISGGNFHGEYPAKVGTSYLVFVLLTMLLLLSMSLVVVVVVVATAAILRTNCIMFYCNFLMSLLLFC